MRGIVGAVGDEASPAPEAALAGGSPAKQQQREKRGIIRQSCSASQVHGQVHALERSRPCMMRSSRRELLITVVFGGTAGAHQQQDAEHQAVVREVGDVAVPIKHVRRQNLRLQRQWRAERPNPERPCHDKATRTPRTKRREGQIVGQQGQDGQERHDSGGDQKRQKTAPPPTGNVNRHRHTAKCAESPGP